MIGVSVPGYIHFTDRHPDTCDEEIEILASIYVARKTGSVKHKPVKNRELPNGSNDMTYHKFSAPASKTAEFMKPRAQPLTVMDFWPCPGYTPLYQISFYKPVKNQLHDARCTFSNSVL